MENAQVFNIGNNGHDVFLKVNTIDYIGEAWYLSIMNDPKPKPQDETNCTGF